MVADGPRRGYALLRESSHEVVLAAGLRLTPSGPLCIRGRPAPLHPYLFSGPYL